MKRLSQYFALWYISLFLMTPNILFSAEFQRNVSNNNNSGISFAAIPLDDGMTVLINQFMSTNIWDAPSMEDLVSKMVAYKGNDVGAYDTFCHELYYAQALTLLKTLTENNSCTIKKLARDLFTYDKKMKQIHVESSTDFSDKINIVFYRAFNEFLQNTKKWIDNDTRINIICHTRDSKEQKTIFSPYVYDHEGNTISLDRSLTHPIMLKIKFDENNGTDTYDFFLYQDGLSYPFSERTGFTTNPFLIYEGKGLHTMYHALMRTTAGHYKALDKIKQELSKTTLDQAQQRLLLDQLNDLSRSYTHIAQVLFLHCGGTENNTFNALVKALECMLFYESYTETYNLTKEGWLSGLASMVKWAHFVKASDDKKQQEKKHIPIDGSAKEGNSLKKVFKKLTQSSSSISTSGNKNTPNVIQDVIGLLEKEQVFIEKKQ